MSVKTYRAGSLQEALDLVRKDLVPDELARELISRLRTSLAEHELDDPRLLAASLARLVEDEIEVCGPIRLLHGRRRLVALVGPTGVGKTTTIAKLAANFRLREKR